MDGRARAAACKRAQEGPRQRAAAPVARLRSPAGRAAAVVDMSSSLLRSARQARAASRYGHPLLRRTVPGAGRSIGRYTPPPPPATCVQIRPSAAGRGRPISRPVPPPPPSGPRPRYRPILPTSTCPSPAHPGQPARPPALRTARPPVIPPDAPSPPASSSSSPPFLLIRSSPLAALLLESPRRQHLPILPTPTLGPCAVRLDRRASNSMTLPQQHPVVIIHPVYRLSTPSAASPPLPDQARLLA
ncbi:hypothetical protein CDD83_9096 [Cordyceps sp. RAO-2017]|nr:hypothetical protein CDD83_9096 [Cordyceps sp. RAO-2017]